MKRKAFSLVELLVVIAILAALAWLLFPVIHRNPQNAPRSACQSNLKQIGLGYLQYVQDYNDRFPILTTEQGWFGALQPYLKSEALFQCPSEKLREKENLTDYWFNRRLAGVGSKKIDNVALTFLSGDGESSDDPNVSLQLLPPRWSEKENSPARRHLDGANYGFVDGHVKWFKPKTIVAPEKEKSAPTFLVR